MNEYNFLSAVRLVDINTTLNRADQVSSAKMRVQKKDLTFDRDPPMP